MKAIATRQLTHRYGERIALSEIDLTVEAREVFGIVGPNGGGKSTLFRILSTLMAPSSGEAKVFGFDVNTHPAEVRRRIGVVFQSPALDKKLTGEENLFLQGRMYGLRGRDLKEKVRGALKRLGLEDRAKERVEKLSGGMKRRIEIAKGLLHEPSLLLLDEPTTGLDPVVRREVWGYLRELNTSVGVTVVTTTHLMDEAAICGRIALVDQGKIVASGEPALLRGTVGGDIISIRAKDTDRLALYIEEAFGAKPTLTDGELRIEKDRGHEFIPLLVNQFSGEIESITLGKPTLEDFFIRKTGRRISGLPAGTMK
jgi:ABC-2 type transport system ATP-binding protein